MKGYKAAVFVLQLVLFPTARVAQAVLFVVTLQSSAKGSQCRSSG